MSGAKIYTCVVYCNIPLCLALVSELIKLGKEKVSEEGSEGKLNFQYDFLLQWHIYEKDCWLNPHNAGMLISLKAS